MENDFFDLQEKIIDLDLKTDDFIKVSFINSYVNLRPIKKRKKRKKRYMGKRETPLVKEHVKIRAIY